MKSALGGLQKRHRPLLTELIFIKKGAWRG